ncbi:hypothetical protein [Nannocystis punicea]|uniref:Protein kinase domain-containing protein n=1 Tax=Nannocystis punicea TaxID=2995304 RepID=A0ABY7GVL8_9BACT|nr:hypothetical protein [Nannocystis poenicansa]WAS91016.1 hypothetical protein O0S08_32915 [Nannocystis poenicansa]
MTEPPPRVPDVDAAVADTNPREAPPVVQAEPGRTRSHPRVEEEPAAPTRIRHFTVLRQVGQGGMGVVLSAFDDELDRKVAIKLMRPSQGDSLGRARLQREAQAVAHAASEYPVFRPVLLICRLKSDSTPVDLFLGDLRRYYGLCPISSGAVSRFMFGDMCSSRSIPGVPSHRYELSHSRTTSSN